MHRAKFLNKPSDRVVYFSKEEFQALEELIHERLREPRQSTSAGHNEQQRLAARQSGRIEGFNSDLNAARDSEVTTASEAILLDRAKSVIASRINFLEDRLSALSTTVARNKKEWHQSHKEFNDRIEAFDVSHTQPEHDHDILNDDIGNARSRLDILEKRMLKMRNALYKAGQF